MRYKESIKCDTYRHSIILRIIALQLKVDIGLLYLLSCRAHGFQAAL